MRKNPLIRAEGVALLSVNVSWKNGCLQAEPFMFASSYIYQHLSLESFDKAYQDAVQTRRASDAGHPQSVTFLWDITYLCWNLTK